MIKARQPKTCSRCRAIQSIGSSRWRCMLWFEVEEYEGAFWAGYTSYEDVHVNIRPVGKCPKPITIAQCAEAYQAFGPPPKQQTGVLIVYHKIN